MGILTESINALAPKDGLDTRETLPESFGRGLRSGLLLLERLGHALQALGLRLGGRVVGVLAQAAREAATRRGYTKAQFQAFMKDAAAERALLMGEDRRSMLKSLPAAMQPEELAAAQKELAASQKGEQTEATKKEQQLISQRIAALHGSAPNMPISSELARRSKPRSTRLSSPC